MVKLPKYLVIILDIDVVQFLKYEGEWTSKLIGKYLNSMVKDIEETIRDRKAQLPNKAKRLGYPLVYWVTAPCHVNFKDNHLRTRFNLCLESIIKNIDGMRMMRMKEIWDFSDDELVDNKGELTLIGLTKYWQSINATIQFNVQRNELAQHRKKLMETPTTGEKLKRKSATKKKWDDNVDPYSQNKVEEMFKRRRRQEEDYQDLSNKRVSKQLFSRKNKFILPRPPKDNSR